MPIYPKGQDRWRVCVWAKGKLNERTAHGPYVAAELLEQKMRVELGAKLKTGVTVDHATAETASYVTWVGGHAGSYVYFVQAGTDGPVKIGFTTSPSLRLSAIQIGSAKRLRLVCAVPGGRCLEMALHKAFAGAQMSGEWFKPTPKLVAMMAELAETNKDGAGPSNISAITKKRIRAKKAVAP
jgi:hypothetical protein